MQRIMIIGPSGSGKSTLAHTIGQRLSLPVVHLDRAYWGPGWVAPAKDAWRSRVAELAAADAWVMDGGYSSTFELRLPRAEAVIWLDLPRRVYFPRTVWRLMRHYGRERGDVGPGCRERFDLGFFRDWVWTYPVRARGRDAALMASLPAHIRAVFLRSPAQVRQFVAALPASLTGDSAVK
jgi:adenylate kinase family enzyme